MEFTVMLEQDECGAWCASAWTDDRRAGAAGQGSTPGQALADLGPALDLVLGEVTRDDVVLASPCAATRAYGATGCT